QSHTAGEIAPWFLLARSTIVTNVWLLFACVYSTIMFLALTSFVLGRSLLVPAYLLVGPAVLATAGIVQGLYFLGRPNQGTLSVVALPLYTIVISLLILFIDQ